MADFEWHPHCRQNLYSISIISMISVANFCSMDFTCEIAAVIYCYFRDRVTLRVQSAAKLIA